MGGQGQPAGPAGRGDPGQRGGRVPATAPAADAGDLDRVAGPGPGPPRQLAVRVAVAGEGAQPPAGRAGHHRPAVHAGSRLVAQQQPGRQDRPGQGDLDQGGEGGLGELDQQLVQLLVAEPADMGGERVGAGHATTLPSGSGGRPSCSMRRSTAAGTYRSRAPEAGGREAAGAGQLVGLPAGDAQPLGGLGQGDQDAGVAVQHRPGRGGGGVGGVIGRTSGREAVRCRRRPPRRPQEGCGARARRGNCWCIGTSLDAQGFRGRVTAPGPDFSDAGSRVLRGSQRAMAPF